MATINFFKAMFNIKVHSIDIQIYIYFVTSNCFYLWFIKQKAYISLMYVYGIIRAVMWPDVASLSTGHKPIVNLH